MTHSHIRYEVDDGVATITIDRPEKRNAMTYAVLADFTDAVWRASDDDAARVVVITGAGGAFCAGTDLSELDDTPGHPLTPAGRRGAGSRAMADRAVPQARHRGHRRSGGRHGRRVRHPGRRPHRQRPGQARLDVEHAIHTGLVAAGIA
jgi:enoyl-CoA hydratase/carnithine racemase